MPVRWLAISAQEAARQPRLCPLITQLPLQYCHALHVPRHKHPRRRAFHATPSLGDAAIDQSGNHYETLKLQPSATPAEVKKSFYSLSKLHHPDINTSDPQASQRFVRIKEAYGVLSEPAARAAYDRDIMRLHHSGGGGPSRPGASYSSSSSVNPAGGRPASGLSKRRSAFRGPPPSFYRNGGWGQNEEKRRAAHEESTGGGDSARRETKDHHNFTGDYDGNNNNTGGMGPGQGAYKNDVPPHFDREGHERTGRRVWDEGARARRARSEAMDSADGEGGASGIAPERGAGGMFLVISGVLLISVLGPLVISRLFPIGSSSQSGEKRGSKAKKGSNRGQGTASDSGPR